MSLSKMKEYIFFVHLMRAFMCQMLMKYTQGPYGRVSGGEASKSCFILGGEMWQSGSEDPDIVPSTLLSRCHVTVGEGECVTPG